MLSTSDRITTPQATIVVINYILGTGILTLPRASAEKVKTPDVWLTVILGGLLAMLAGIIIVKLSQQFPEKTFYQYSQVLIGKWCGWLVSLLIVCYFVGLCGLHVRALAEVTSFFLLEGTPSWAIIMPFMWGSLYLTMGGINSMTRLFEIIFPITVVIFLLIAFMGLGVFEIDNLRPVLGLGIAPISKGLKTTALSYSGIEIMIFLLVFMKQPQKAGKVILVGTLIPLIFYVITVIMVIGVLSVDGVLTRTWPTIDLMRSFEMPGLIFERFESLLLVIWIMQIFTSFNMSHYAASLGLSQLFKRNIYPCMLGLLPVIYIVSEIPKNVNDLFKLGDIVGNAAWFLFGLLPPLLLVISKLKGGNHEAQ